MAHRAVAAFPLAAIGAAVLAPSAISPVSAQNSAQAASMDPKQCAFMANEFRTGLGAQDVQFRVVQKGEGTNAVGVSYCELTGKLSAGPGSSIGVAYRLPQQWNGKVLGLGGGGLAGNVRIDTAADGLRRGYATMQTDAGHPSTVVYDTEWARIEDRPNVPAIQDFAYRAVHEMTVAGKRVVAGYYGKAPSRAYFQGCSQGGRQGMEEAQRFPGDYDGIISGAPAFDHIGSIASQSLSSRAFRSQKLTPEKLALVHNDALAVCDAMDGAADGLVSYPMQCNYNPARLLCAPGKSAGCLSQGEVDAVTAAYANRKSPDGKTFAFGLPVGSELTSFPLFQAMAPRDAQEFIGVGNLAPALEFRSGVDYRTNDVVSDFWGARNSLFSVLIQADKEDMSDFIVGGGKLIFWHGTHDPILSYARFHQYYTGLESVTSHVLRDRGAASSFADGIRFFPVLGISHCAGGTGPDQVDFLGALEDWVEKGRAPARLIATRADRKDEGPMAPVESSIISRPVCAWPQVAKYSGKGDVNVASSFVCTPRTSG